MKTLLLFILATTSFSMFSQTGKIKGTATDSITQVGLPFCAYSLYQNGELTPNSGYTDTDGRYVISNLNSGEYVLRIGDVSHPEKKFAVGVSNGTTAMLNPQLSNNMMDGFDLIVDGSPFNPGAPTEVILGIEAIEHSPVASLGVEAMAEGATSDISRDPVTGSLYVRGSRAGTTIYIIDGIKMEEPTRLPSSSIAEMRVMTSGIPAEFGDATGGIIYITTKSVFNH